MTDHPFRTACVASLVACFFSATPALPARADVQPTQTPAASSAALTDFESRAQSIDQQIKTDVQTTLPQARLELVLANQALQSSQEADDAKAQAAKCRRLAQVQSAFTGGLALNPAAYGKTYIQVASLLAPIFFSGCSSGSAGSSSQTQAFANQKAIAEKAVTDIQARIATNEQMLILYQQQLLSVYKTRLGIH